MSALLIFFLTFFSLALVLPSLRVWRQTGINPVVLPASDDVSGFVGNAFKLMIFLLGMHIVIGALKLSNPIGQVTLPDFAAVVGWGLLAISIFWVMVAQFQMGRSWRVGVDTKIKTDLVVHGLFQFSRNPIFLGMMTQLTGLFLVQPDAITLAILMAGYILISVQIRQEEQHLVDLHGAAYHAYCSKVRRWL